MIKKRKKIEKKIKKNKIGIQKEKRDIDGDIREDIQENIDEDIGQDIGEDIEGNIGCNNKNQMENALKDGIFDKTLLSSFMKGFLRIIVLWIITKERIHGYEIIKKLKEKDEELEEIDFKGPGPNKIYPILHELEKKELIRGDWEFQGKRKLKFYEATQKGINTIDILRKKPHKDVPSIMKEFWQDVIYSNKYNHNMDDIDNINNIDERIDERSCKF